MPSFPPDLPLYLLAGAAIVGFVLAQRVPLVRTATRLTITVLLVGGLLFAFAKREQFDPYLGQISSLLNLDRQEVAGTETRIQMSPDGHFWARATIDGLERRLLIDSGATVTALSTRTAQAAKLDVRDSFAPIILRTANGDIRPQTSQVRELGLGNIVARDLAVVVSPAFGETNVIGMNFLSRLKSWRVEGKTLILVPNHPRAPKENPKLAS